MLSGGNDCQQARQAPAALDRTHPTVHRGSVTEELEHMVNRAKSRVRPREAHDFAIVNLAVELQQGAPPRSGEEAQGVRCIGTRQDRPNRAERRAADSIAARRHEAAAFDLKLLHVQRRSKSIERKRPANPS